MSNKIIRKIESYPTRQFRLEDTTWERLKEMKLESGKTWEKFLADLIKAKQWKTAVNANMSTMWEPFLLLVGAIVIHVYIG